VKANEVFVTPKSFLGSATASVQRGVDAATAGNTVHVAPGTYTENVTINKSLTLLGPNAEVPFIPGGSTVRHPEATLTRPKGSAPALTVASGAGAVTVSGIMVTTIPEDVLNTTIKLVDVKASGNTVVVSNSLLDLGVKDQCGSAVFSAGFNKLRLVGNQFEDGRYSSQCSLAYDSRTVYVDAAEGFAAESNTFVRTGHSIFLVGMPSGVLRPSITGNAFVSGAQHITVGQTASGLDIVGNTITAGNGMYFDSSSDVVVSNNDFSLPAGMSIYLASGTPAATFSVQNNALRSPGYGSSAGSPWANNSIFHFGTGQLSLQNNWWEGRAPGAGVHSNSPATTVSEPWIQTFANDPNRLGEPGFWPVSVAQACHKVGLGSAGDLHCFDTIAAAVAAAPADEAITLWSGTYTEDVSLSKNGLTLRAATFHDATVSGKVTIDADDVTVQGLRIRSTGSDGVAISGGKRAPRVLDNIIEDPANATNNGGQRGIVTSPSGWNGQAEIARNTITGFLSGAFVQGTLGAEDSMIIRDNVVRDLDPGNTAFPNDQVGGSTLYTGNQIGPGIRNGISTDYPASNITIRGNTITGATEKAVTIRGSFITVAGNRLSGNYDGIAIRSNASASAISTLVVRNNDLSNASHSGVLIEAGAPSSTLDVSGNFWGVGVTPTVSAGVVGPTVTDLRSQATDQVIVSPWLDAFGGRPVLQGGEILVTVTDASGNPVSGVGIAVGSATPVNSGADGRVRLTSLQPGVYDVTITPGGERLMVGSATRRVNVTASQAAVLDVVVVDKGAISGRVVDAAGEGIAGLMVTAAGQTATSDTSGGYTITGLNPGPYTVTLSELPSGLVAAGPTARRVNLAAGSSATADFMVARIGAMTGSVRDTGGRSVSNATVTLDKACSAGGSTSTTTDAFGRYRFQNCTVLDTYTVTLTVPGGFVADGVVARLVNLASGSSATADFTVSQTGRIGGRVLDTTGVGVAGVQVSLNGAAPQETDLDGRFAFTGQTADTYTVTLGALPAGYAPGSVDRLSVVVASGGAATADFTVIRTGGITGRVVDLGGLGVAGVAVSLIGGASTTTSLDGTYQILNQPSGRYTVSITTPNSYVAVGAASRVVLVTSGQGARADFRLAELGAVEGRIVDETGAGLAGVEVTIDGTTVRTAPDGVYRRSGLTQGVSVSFAATLPANVATASAVPTTVTVGAAVADVVLARLGTVAGFAYVDLNGNDMRDEGEPPLAGVVVTLSNPLSTATTSANGFYRFDQVPLNSTVSFAAPSGFQSVTTNQQQASMSMMGGLRLMNGDPLATFIEDKGLLPVGTAIGYVTLNGEPLAGVTVKVGAASQLTSADGVALFSNVVDGSEVTIEVPAGFELTTRTPGTPVTTFELSVAGAPDTGGTTPAPPGSTPSTEVRERFQVRPVGVTPVTVTTPDGPVVLRFSGISVASGVAPEVVVRPLGYDATARGVQAAGPRFRITAERFAFDDVEVCVPVNSVAVRASGARSDRVRLVHTRSDGTEYDITTRLDLTGTVGEVCGVADTFSTFQAAIVVSQRVAGEDRYATAASTALELHPDGAATVYIATGADFPDALAAGAAAAAADAPLLLVRRDGVPAVTRTALASLRPTTIVLVGGTNAVTADVEAQLVALTGATVTRVAGIDRYDTAALLAQRQFPNGASSVYVATGANFPDALAAGAAAAREGAALLLVPAQGVPNTVRDALTALAPQRIVVAGGTAAVSAATVSQLRTFAGTVERVAGVDRYDTAARLTTGVAAGGTLVIATGRDFPDALVATALATRRGGSVLLVAGTIPPATTQRRAVELAPTQMVVLGGVRAVTPTAELRLVRQLPPAVPGRL
jgi:putative cell wall-binding protein/nitrogen fixation protein FixH